MRAALVAARFALRTPGGDTMTGIFASFARDETGATAVEYGLLAALIGVAVIAGAASFTTETREMYVYLGNAVEAGME